MGYAAGMATIDDALHIRSRFARERAAELARRTGMTEVQVVEEALRAYAPPVADERPPEEPPPGRLVRRGRFLVMPAEEGEPAITVAEVEAAIEEIRNERC